MNVQRGTRSGRGAWIALALLLSAAACQLPPANAGESYTPKGDPWAARDGGGGGSGDGSGAAKREGTATESVGAAAKSASPAGATAKEPASSEGLTVLEQLDQARAKAKALEGENQKLKDDAAALTALVEQLRRENQNLAQLADASAQSRASLDQELEKQIQKLKELETRCLALADDLLSERIQRVRVERELILAKVKDAEKQDDGP